MSKIRREWLWGLVITSIFTILSTVVILIFASIRATDQNNQLNELKRNHDAQVCFISVIHQLSQSSGKDPAETKANYDTIFQTKWLQDNCSFTEEEAKRVVGQGQAPK